MSGATATLEAPKAPAAETQVIVEQVVRQGEITPTATSRDRGGMWPGLPGTIANVCGNLIALAFTTRIKDKKRARRLRLSLALSLVGSWIYPLVIRPWHLRWGATKEEADAPMPGDGEVEHPVYESTRAITINAPVEEVWPWLVQIGYKRGGFYSYDWLENMAAWGARMRTGYKSADAILPEFQDLKVGDKLPLAESMALPVVALEPYRTIVLAAHGSPTGDPALDGDFCWVWTTRPIDAYTTRIVTRFRVSMKSKKAVRSTGASIEPMHFVMERKMLLGIKKRAEKRS